MAGGPGQLEQQGLIDAQRIGRIGPLIARHAMAEQDPGRQRQHLLDEGRRWQAALASAEPIPVEPGVEASLGVAALITGQDIPADIAEHGVTATPLSPGRFNH